MKIQVVFFSILIFFGGCLDMGKKQNQSKVIEQQSTIDSLSSAYADCLAEKEIDHSRPAIQFENLKKHDSLAKYYNHFNKTTDPFTNLTIYRHTSNKNDNKNVVYCYIAEKEGVYNLRLAIQYIGVDWLFVEKYLFLVDGKRFSIDVSTGTVSQETTKNGIYEYFDALVNYDNAPGLSFLSGSKDALIRYQGKSKHYDRNIAHEEKESIRETIHLYELLSGQSIFK
jgi:hypothetical protein